MSLGDYNSNIIIDEGMGWSMSNMISGNLPSVLLPSIALPKPKAVAATVVKEIALPKISVPKVNIPPPAKKIVDKILSDMPFKKMGNIALSKAGQVLASGAGSFLNKSSSTPGASPVIQNQIAIPKAQVAFAPRQTTASKFNVEALKAKAYPREYAHPMIKYMKG